MRLNDLQQRLEDIYAIQTSYPVEAFVTTNRELADTLENNPAARCLPEKLLIRTTADGIDLSLYLDKTIVDQLSVCDITSNGHEDHMETFCTAVEGISHFVYLLWRAQQGYSVSLLELELQAEVDKYIMAVAILAQHDQGKVPLHLHAQLFDHCYFDPQLNSAELQRYQQANVFARDYCLTLHNTLMKHGDSYTVTREIRRFYRLWHTQKLQYIRQHYLN